LKRGEIYRVRRPPGDPKPARALVVVSRQGLIDSAFSTVICAPVATQRLGLSTQVSVGQAEGLKHDSCIQCDSLVSIEKTRLTDFIGQVSAEKLGELDIALSIALGLPAQGA
jgi:mRNA interferase MazF